MLLTAGTPALAANLFARDCSFGVSANSARCILPRNAPETEDVSFAQNGHGVLHPLEVIYRYNLTNFLYCQSWLVQS